MPGKTAEDHFPKVFVLNVVIMIKNGTLLRIFIVSGKWRCFTWPNDARTLDFPTLVFVF
jgi:hypothetical protein